MGSDNNKRDTVRLEDTDITHVVTEDTFKRAFEEAGKTPPAFVCLVGPPKYQGKRWVIRKPNLTIGRTIENDIFIDDFSVSKSHAKISFSEGNVLISDLESTNKTVINGKIVPSFVAILLQENDQIKLGNVILKFLEKGSLESVSFQKSYDLRLRDPLTGIFNRGAMLSRAEEEFKRADTLNSELSVIIIDIDHFKEVNDTYGHAAGDYVLKEMTKVVQHHVIRSEDFFARYGGEEFIVILSDMPIGRATEVAERIREAIEKHDFDFEDQNIPITISAGIASKSGATEDWDELFKKADQACYKSKRDGRNRITAL